MRRLRYAVATAVLCAAVAVLGAPLSTARATTAEAAANVPNIVVIITDDQSAGMLSPMPKLRTLIASRGVTYPTALVPTSLCCPSRAAILSGRYAHETDMWRNVPPHGGWHTFHRSGVEKETLAAWLDGAGYHTALVGKYLNGFDAAPLDFTPPGWDRFVTYDGAWNGRYYDYRLRSTTDAGTTVQAYGSSPSDYSTDVFAHEAIKAIEATPEGSPLFLVFTPYAAHKPFTPAPRHVDSWPRRPITSPAFNEADVTDKPAWVQELPRVSRQQAEKDKALRMETLRAVDDAVGSIVDALGPRMSDTLFVFTSDQGFLLGEHRWVGKNVPYDRATRIPLIVRWDGRLPAGVSDSRVALNIDITTTIVEAAGLDQPTSGRSLLGPATRQGTVLESIDARSASPAYCGWRSRRWLFVEYSDGLGRELYDYRRDPHELENLADRPDHLERLIRLRNQAIEACDPLPPDFTW